MNIEKAYSDCIKSAESIGHGILRNVALKWLRDNQDKLMGLKGSDWQHHNYAGGLVVHIQRVVEISVHIAEMYPVDMDLVKFCALLHDAGKLEDYQLDDTFETGQEQSINQSLLGHSYEGARKIEQLLKEEFIGNHGQCTKQDERIIAQCTHCIGTHMIGCGAINKQQMLEVFLVSKADHIDAELSQTIVKAGENWFETASGNKYYTFG